MKKELVGGIVVSVLCYLLFFFPLLSSNKIIYSGKDAVDFHYQTRIYLYESFKQGSFPFWTEKLHLGYPLYADLQRGMLNPVNIMLLALFGPFSSYKIMHFSVYLLGSLSLFALFKRLKHSFLAFIAGNFIYFFNFFVLYHQQHFNIVLCYYLFPTMLLLTLIYLQKQKFIQLFYKAMVWYFVFTLGHFQLLMLYIFIDAILFVIFSSRETYTKRFFIQIAMFVLVVLILILPALVSQAALYKESSRLSANSYKEGSVYPVMLLNLIKPFPFDRDAAYFGINLNAEYFMHEVYIYTGIVSLVLAIVGFLTLKDKRMSLFIIVSLWFVIVLSAVKSMPFTNGFFGHLLFFPFTLFRYWIRASALVPMIVVLSLAHLFSGRTLSLKKINRSNSKNLVFLIGFASVVQLLNLNSEAVDYMRIFVKQLFTVRPDNLLWAGLFMLTFVALAVFIVNKKYMWLLVPLVFLDAFSFWKIGSGSLFADKKNLVYEKIELGIPQHARVIDLTGRISSHNYLLQDTWSPFGYSALVPEYTERNLRNLGFASSRYQIPNKNLHNFLDFANLEKLGVKYIVTNDNNSNPEIFELNTRILSSPQVILENDEGRFVLAPLDKTEITGKIETKLRYFTGWLGYDGENWYFPKKNPEGTVNFNVDKKIERFEIFYLPIPLLAGAAASLGLTAVYLFVYSVYRKKYA